MAQHQQQPLWWWQRKQQQQQRQQQQQSSSALANPLPGVHLKEWDQGVLVGELINHGLFPRPIQISKTTNLITPADQPKDSDGIRVGTFSGSQKAATEVYSRIEQRFSSYFDVAGFEPSIPQQIAFGEKKLLYTYQKLGSDKYPPHLHLIPPRDLVPLTSIFQFMALIDTGSLLGMVIPETILDWVNGDPDRGGTIAALEARNKQLRSEKKTILAEPNVADHADWYTDAVFGQQQLTGVNPTTLTLATSEWLSNFKSAALAQQNDKIGQFLQNAAPYSLYMQDCSWFRKAVGAAADEVMVSDDADRWATASVSLFHLNPAGKLHPLAIFIDWKGTAKDSVCSFNRRLQDSDSKDNEATDWPWRYAKTCSQISDWVRHEVQIHLVNTHFVEEAGIVACHRCFPSDHPVFQLLQPHWLKTLSLNAAARAALVPAVVTKLVGISDAQTYRFMTSVYEDFDWEALYIPNDLKRRGFPEDRLFTDPMFHNYAYGKDMSILWRSFHKFVSAMLRPHYKTDNDVLEDIYVGQWVEEMRRPTGANLKKFPDIRTFEDLVNAAVMMIHIASVEHTAVNYLQEYYQSFVINKPPALCTPPVASVAALQQIDEVAYMRSLPVDRPRQWLLASHLPHLLSFRVSEEQNLLTYAASKAKLSALNGDAVGRDAATGLWNDLTVMIGVFQEHSDMIDEQTCKYEVLNPHAIANSILI